MKITKISTQVNTNSRYNVFIDDEFALSLSANDIINYKIYKGKEINDELLNNLKISSLKSYLFDSCIRYLGRRPRSIKEIDIYLNKKIISAKNNTVRAIKKEELISQIIAKLINKDYLDDEKFAEWFVESRLSSKNIKSRKEINYELIQKGIDRNIINKVLDNKLNPDIEKNNAYQICEKKFKSLIGRYNDETVIKSKLITYMAGKGYSYATTKTIIDSIFTSTYNRRS